MKEGYPSPEFSPMPAKRGKKEVKTHSLIGQVLEQKLQKKETRPPINQGEIFVPEESLTVILKLPKAERQAKIKEFKEKLTYQKEGLAKIQEEIITVIQAFPDTSYNQLFERAKDMGAQYGLDWWQEEVIRLLIQKYVEKHKAVQKARKEYPNDNDLFEAVFGRQPKGRVEVSEGPMTLYFKVQNPEDYTFIFSTAFLTKREPTAEEISRIQKSGGGLIKSSLLPGLEGAIIIENAVSPMPDGFPEQVRLHEEQHAITELFEKENRRLRNNWFLLPEAYFNVMAGGMKNLEKNLRRYFVYSRRAEEENITKNEILSFFKQGISTPETIKYLMEKDGLYDYLPKLDNDISTLFIAKLGQDNEPLIKKIAAEVFDRKKYEQSVEDAMEVFSALRKKGHTLEQTIALLQPEPFFKWKKTYKRLTGESIKNIQQNHAPLEVPDKKFQ